jgi:hypothetical protein
MVDLGAAPAGMASVVASRQSSPAPGETIVQHETAAAVMPAKTPLFLPEHRQSVLCRTMMFQVSLRADRPSKEMVLW